MKALSIRQPWAWLIAQGVKNIENRTWHTKFRGRILIHAGKKIDKAAYEHIELDLLPAPAEMETGGIIGITEIIDCVKTSRSEWFSGPFGFKLINSSSLPFTPCRGRLSFFVPDIAPIVL